MSNIKVRQNIVIRHFCQNGVPKWNENINVNFVPDEMIVRYVVFFNSGLANVLSVDSFVPPDQPDVGDPVPVPQVSLAGYSTVSFLYTDLVDNYICPIIDVNLFQKPDTVWKINGPVSGTYSFSIDLINSTPDTLRVGTLVIHLEFLQYSNK